MPTYKLLYFDFRGRGEPARMLFNLKGQDFEDVRIALTPEEWPKVKADPKQCPIGQVPVLFVDGEAMPQSSAIYRYLAREFGYYGANNMEGAHIDVILGTLEDLEVMMLPMFVEKDEAKKATMRQEFKETRCKPFYSFLNDSIKKAGGKFFVGNKLSLADLVVYNNLEMIRSSKAAIEGAVEQYPDLVTFLAGIRNDSELKTYLDSRPAADF